MAFPDLGNMWRNTLRLLFCCLACAVLCCGAAHTQEVARGREAAKDEPLPPELASSIASSIPALADFKKGLLDLGFNFSVGYSGELWGNPTGGVKQGATNEGLLELDLDGNLEKIIGLKDATFHTSAFVFHGRGLSLFNILNLSTVSAYEQLPTTRLFEAYFEQQLFERQAAIRIGQLSADTEFFISDLAASYLLNGTFGWPIINGVDLPGGGGPNYPLATPGVRLKLAPNEQTTLLLALFNGDPSGAGFTGQQQILNPAGVNFLLDQPAFVIAEAQVRYNQDANSSGPGGTLKFGGWHNFGNFNDQRFGLDGLPLASPLSDSVPLVHRGDTGLYGVLDQMIWHLPGADWKKGVGFFTRASVAPSDRNLVDFYVDGGLNFTGLWEQRPDDAFGAAASFARISPQATAADRDLAFFTQSETLIQDYEIDFELSYVAQISPGIAIHPDFQYIFHPGGGGANPFNPAMARSSISGRIPDAAVFGIRTGIKF